jgi:para-nitrobenzyl esterase
MRKLNADVLVNSAPSEPAFGSPLHLKPLALEVGPVVDGKVIPDEPNAMFAAGRQHAVPMIVGNTRNEMSLFLLWNKMPADETAYLKQLKDDFGDLAPLIAAAYPVSDTEQIPSAVSQLTTDLSFASETRLIARTHAAAGQKTFRYQFSRSSKRGFLRLLGAHHGSEVAFLFQRPLGHDEADVRISRILGRYWIDFAATGNPNGEGLPDWPAYRPNADQMIDFADDVNVLTGYRNDQLDAIEKVLQMNAGLPGTR